MTDSAVLYKTENGIEFADCGDYIVEVGTELKFDGENGFQTDGKRRIALGSYAAFGNDAENTRIAKERWLEAAKEAWKALKEG